MFCSLDYDWICHFDQSLNFEISLKEIMMHGRFKLFLICCVELLMKVEFIFIAYEHIFRDWMTDGKVNLWIE